MEYKSEIENELANILKPQNKGFDKLLESMNYSLLAGGKRIRPILVLEFCRISGGDYKTVLPVACAIEMIHTYSLIHDDLPCMDNDDLRRGKPTNHIVYGECTATLSGDALQAEAFRTILNSDLSSEIKCNCANTLAYAAGVNGICGGQYLDTVNDSYDVSEEDLDEINSRKTGAMLVAACKMGAIAGGANAEQIAAAEEFGNLIGKAFQIKDDVLDVISTEEELGKPIDSDKSNNKKTYMEILGESGCNAIIKELTEKAKNVINSVYSDTDFLCKLAESLASRTN